MSGLLSEAFYSGDANLPLRPLFASLFGLRIMWHIVVIIMFRSSPGNALCFLATHNGREEAAAAEAEAVAAEGRSDAEGRAVNGGRDNDASRQSKDAAPPDRIVGMGTVHMVQPRGDMVQALGATPRTSFAMVTNMVVQPEHQGRGIGRAMLAACEELACKSFRPRPRGLLLLVYRDNLRAIALYQSVGYRHCKEWVDPAWLQDAEKGRIGNARRLLFCKDVLGPASTTTSPGLGGATC